MFSWRRYGVVLRLCICQGLINLLVRSIAYHLPLHTLPSSVAAFDASRRLVTLQACKVDPVEDGWIADLSRRFHSCKTQVGKLAKGFVCLVLPAGFLPNCKWSRGSVGRRATSPRGFISAISTRVKLWNYQQGRLYDALDLLSFQGFNTSKLNLEGIDYLLGNKLAGRFKQCKQVKVCQHVCKLCSCFWHPKKACKTTHK